MFLSCLSSDFQERAVKMMRNIGSMSFWGQYTGPLKALWKMLHCPRVIYHAGPCVFSIVWVILIAPKCYGNVIHLNCTCRSCHDINNLYISVRYLHSAFPVKTPTFFGDAGEVKSSNLRGEICALGTPNFGGQPKELDQVFFFEIWMRQATFICTDRVEMVWCMCMLEFQLKT